MTPIAANGKSPKLYRIVALISSLPAQSRMPKRSSAMPFETLLLIRTTLLKFKYTTSLSRLYHKRGCRTRSSPMLQPLARTRFREKILKVLLLTFLSRKVGLTFFSKKVRHRAKETGRRGLNSIPRPGEFLSRPEQPAAPVAAGSYTVKKGDTYGTIALNNYGTYGVWSELYKANKGVKLTEGATLVLPEKLGKVAHINAPAAASGETLYTVKAGDTLGAIAKATYGDVMKYKTIFERNADRLVNANTIYEGQVIVLPAK